MATAKFFNPDTEQWEPVAQGMSPNSFVTDETPAGAVDGTNKNFTTAQSYIPGTLEVYINGLRQASGSHVTEISSEAGTFSLDTAPQSGDVLRVAYQHSTAASGNAQTLSGYSASTNPGPGQIPVVDENGALDVDGDIYSNGEKVLVGSKTTDANGWTVYDYGGWKEYKKNFTGSGSSIAANGGLTLIDGADLPVGVANLSGLNLHITTGVQWSGYFTTMQEALGASNPGASTALKVRMWNAGNSAANPGIWLVSITITTM